MRASESTPASCTSPPWRCSDRNATERETEPPSGLRTPRASRSICAKPVPGDTPAQPTRTDRCASGSAATVFCSARSRAARLPPARPATSAQAIAMPPATSAPRPGRVRARRRTSCKIAASRRPGTPVQPYTGGAPEFLSTPAPSSARGRAAPRRTCPGSSRAPLRARARCAAPAPSAGRSRAARRSASSVDAVDDRPRRSAVASAASSRRANATDRLRPARPAGRAGRPRPTGRARTARRPGPRSRRTRPRVPSAHPRRQSRRWCPRRRTRAAARRRDRVARARERVRDGVRDTATSSPSGAPSASAICARRSSAAEVARGVGVGALDLDRLEVDARCTDPADRDGRHAALARLAEHLRRVPLGTRVAQQDQRVARGIERRPLERDVERRERPRVGSRKPQERRAVPGGMPARPRPDEQHATARGAVARPPRRPRRRRSARRSSAGWRHIVSRRMLAMWRTVDESEQPARRPLNIWSRTVDNRPDDHGSGIPAKPRASGSTVELRPEGGAPLHCDGRRLSSKRHSLLGDLEVLPHPSTSLALRWFTSDTGAWEIDVELARGASRRRAGRRAGRSVSTAPQAGAARSGYPQDERRSRPRRSPACTPRARRSSSSCSTHPRTAAPRSDGAALPRRTTSSASSSASSARPG